MDKSNLVLLTRFLGNFVFELMNVHCIGYLFTYNGIICYKTSLFDDFLERLRNRRTVKRTELLESYI